MTAKPLILSLFVVAVVLAVATVAWWPARNDRASGEPFIEVAKGAHVLVEPDPVAEFRLLDHEGKPFENAALTGKWSFLFFGFTHCPDACPTTLAVFNEVHRTLSVRPDGTRDVQFVLVSVDPARDTPQLLREYVTRFNPAFVGVTGDEADIARLSQSVGVMYAKVPGPTPESYSMDHSTAVLLTNPEGKLHGIFAAPHAPQDMAQAFLKMRAR